MDWHTNEMNGQRQGSGTKVEYAYEGAKREAGARTARQAQVAATAAATAAPAPPLRRSGQRAAAPPHRFLGCDQRLVLADTSSRNSIALFLSREPRHCSDLNARSV